MQSVTRLTFAGTFFAIVTVLAGWFLALPLQLNAQNTCSGTQGQNGVYNATCNNGNPGVVGSSAFIDASMFPAAGRDFCGVLKFILSSSTYPPAGAVIDARGLPGTTGTNMTCSASPWAGITNPPPATILLPATGGTTPTPIVISSIWVLPSNTHLIGEGDGPFGTTIQDASGTALSTMLQFGSSTICPSSVCTGISVENLTLDGQAQSVDGIINQFAQNNSYVNHVRIYQILGVGLNISTTGANNSGPYSNILFDTGGYSGLSSTVCASINGTNSTCGIHGLTCHSETNDANAAILLDSSSNSISDVRIVGFYDGIRVGANANAQSNVLLNIIGDTDPTGGGTTPIIVVHITNSNTVSDLSVMGANNAPGGSSSTITIQDDSFSPSTQLTDTSVAMYALGEKDTATGAYSRYTTSPNAVTWVVGSSAPPMSGTTCSRGSLFSCVGGTTSCGGKALYSCKKNGTAWVAIM
jgi:hypothetical protein